MATLISLGLNNYVDGLEEAPSKVLSTDATKPILTYRSWYRQDQILLGLLHGSSSDTLQPIGCGFEPPLNQELHLMMNFVYFRVFVLWVVVLVRFVTVFLLLKTLFGSCNWVHRDVIVIPFVTL